MHQRTPRNGLLRGKACLSDICLIEDETVLALHECIKQLKTPTNGSIESTAMTSYLRCN